ncbi:carbohydrate ABC transporter permease [Pseudonocardia kunmingensis]|uniref:Carbohydrate ABC transporter membrane protein 1 (CUT1 family) n=1 Tax=Pseudonocardia kunmingensis TaxID=630975 RepID=A0A543E284_9PSEU|nr:sugar ABC transporter permease [Pseudonocardia kunmingensis]TQM15559.1 carbohydrate ABC transporter membrane protein 1 (CUT1 family) [Pseudonocardia kunmingensis]
MTAGAVRAPAAPPPGTGRKRGRKRGSGRTLASADARAGLALISPTLVIVVVMVVVPILWTVLLAFQRLRLLNLRSAGLFGEFSLANFDNVFGAGSFWSALATTLAYSVLGTAGAIGIGLAAALALRRPFRGRGFVRSLMLLPYVAPIVAATFAWTTMLNPQFGVTNHWGTRVLGWDEPIAFLSQRSSEVTLLGLTFGVPTALLTVIAFEAWRSFPFAFLFLTARLQAVPGVLEEAARVDGATLTQRFRHVLLPQLMPTIAVLAVLRFIWTFNSFDDIYLLTGGGAGTEVVAVSVFNSLTARGNIGEAAAQALVLAAILALLVGLYLWRLAPREERS